jgi:hypothetical protein
MEGIEMRISWIPIPLLIALSGSAHLLQAAGLPLISSVEPGSARVGDQLTARGTNLGQDTVAALYLTDGSNDIKMIVLDQSADEIRFRIPPEATPGRFALMILTKGAEPKLIEQPVKVVVENITAESVRPRGGDSATWRSERALR